MYSWDKNIKARVTSSETSCQKHVTHDEFKDLSFLDASCEIKTVANVLNLRYHIAAED